MGERPDLVPGSGLLTALAYVPVIGRADRFRWGKQIASYVGPAPSEGSSGIGDGWGISSLGSCLRVIFLVECRCPTSLRFRTYRCRCRFRAA